jgi:bacteriorhodopsin
MAFLTCLLLDFVSYLFTVDKDKSRLFYFVLVINGLPVVSYGLLAAGVAPVLVDAHGRRFITLRFVVWLFTTPAMLYLYSMVSCIPRRELIVAMVLEYIVILTGVLASLLPSLYGIPFLMVRRARAATGPHQRARVTARAPLAPGIRYAAGASPG